MKFHETKAGTKLPIMSIKGKDYLQVQWRLVWFREEKPEWGIETELLQSSEQHTLARAVIKNENQRIIATAHKLETKEGFADHSEKAETGAIGRALSLIGYGTQFTDELDEGSRIVDAPVAQSLSSERIPLEEEMPPWMQQTMPPTPVANPKPSNSWIVPNGKYRGMKIEYISSEERANYAEYLSGSASRENKPLTGWAKEFVQRVKDINELS